MVLKRFNLYYNITHESYLSGLLQIISAPETGNPRVTCSPAAMRVLKLYGRLAIIGKIIWMKFCIIIINIVISMTLK